MTASLTISPISQQSSPCPHSFRLLILAATHITPSLHSHALLFVISAPILRFSLSISLASAYPLPLQVYHSSLHHGCAYASCPFQAPPSSTPCFLRVPHKLIFFSFRHLVIFSFGSLRQLYLSQFWITATRFD